MTPKEKAEQLIGQQAIKRLPLEICVINAKNFIGDQIGMLQEYPDAAQEKFWMNVRKELNDI